MRIATFQMKAIAGDVTANLARIEAAAVQAADGGARILVAPELATTGYGAGSVISDLAEPCDGQQVAQLTAIAQEYRLAIVAGFAEREGAGVFNSLVFADGDSEPVIYRKRQLYGAYERALFSPGPPASALCAVDGLTLGLLICYDVEFPEFVRELALAGADAVLGADGRCRRVPLRISSPPPWFQYGPSRTSSSSPTPIMSDGTTFSATPDCPAS